MFLSTVYIQLSLALIDKCGGGLNEYYIFPTNALAVYKHGCGVHWGIVKNCQFSFSWNEFNLLGIQV
jgi:hypothetical protein